MKAKIIALAFSACAAAATITSASAFAASPVDMNANGYDAQQAHQWAPIQSSPKVTTRAEFRQELARAQKDGQLAALNKLYQGG